MKISTKKTTSLKAHGRAKADAGGGIEIVASDVDVEKGDTAKLEAHVVGTSGPTAGTEWESSDESIASVQKNADGSALLTAKAPGTTTITATIDDKTASVDVVVEAEAVDREIAKLSKAGRSIVAGVRLSEEDKHVARKLGVNPASILKLKRLDAAKAINAVTGDLASKKAGGVSPEQRHINKKLGISDEDFLKSEAKRAARTKAGG